MAAAIYVAENFQAKVPANSEDLGVWLDDTGVYWFLYRYFESANLDRRDELVDLYGGAEIDGYQLDRLEDEMKSARVDVQAKPEQWSVLTGWNNAPARENEIWKVVHRSAVLETIDRLLALIALARSQNLKLIVSGD